MHAKSTHPITLGDCLVVKKILPSRTNFFQSHNYYYSYYYSAMSNNCRWHKSLFVRNLSRFCEFRLELGLWIKIPVKQATFSQSAF